MFNVTVLRLKDIMKYIICIFVLILLIFSIANYFTNTKKDTKEVTTKIENVTNEISNNNLLSCLDATIPAVASINNNKEKSEKTLNKNQILKSILETQISSLNTIELDNLLMLKINCMVYKPYRHCELVDLCIDIARK